LQQFITSNHVVTTLIFVQSISIILELKSIHGAWRHPLGKYLKYLVYKLGIYGLKQGQAALMDPWLFSC